MARYIDADALIKYIQEEVKQDRPDDFKIENIQRFIKDQPTAYDVEKVEEKLKLLLDLAKSALNSEVAISAGRKTFIQERYKGHIEMLEQVINIVKAGGVG